MAEDRTGGVMIRPAVSGDIPAMVEMGRRFHAEAPIRNLHFSADKIAALLAQLIETGGLFVVEQDGTVRGMGSAIAAESWFGNDRVAQELFWWCEGCGTESLELRRRLEEWAKEQGCVRFVMGCLANGRAPVMTRLYRREGYDMTEHHFMKGL